MKNPSKTRHVAVSRPASVPPLRRVEGYKPQVEGWKGWVPTQGSSCLLGLWGHLERTPAPENILCLTYFLGKELNFQSRCSMRLHFPLEMGPSDLNS